MEDTKHALDETLLSRVIEGVIQAAAELGLAYVEPEGIGPEFWENSAAPADVTDADAALMAAFASGVRDLDAYVRQPDWPDRLRCEAAELLGAIANDPEAVGGVRALQALQAIASANAVPEGIRAVAASYVPPELKKKAVKHQINGVVVVVDLPFHTRRGLTFEVEQVELHAVRVQQAASTLPVGRAEGLVPAVPHPTYPFLALPGMGNSVAHRSVWAKPRLAISARELVRHVDHGLQCSLLSLGDVADGDQVDGWQSLLQLHVQSSDLSLSRKKVNLTIRHRNGMEAVSFALAKHGPNLVEGTAVLEIKGRRLSSSDVTVALNGSGETTRFEEGTVR